MRFILLTMLLLAANSAFGETIHCLTRNASYQGTAKVIYRNQDRGTCDLKVAHHFIPQKFGEKDGFFLEFRISCQQPNGDDQYGTGNPIPMILFNGKVNEGYDSLSGWYTQSELSHVTDFKGTPTNPPYHEVTHLTWSKDCRRLDFKRTESGSLGFFDIQSLILK